MFPGESELARYRLAKFPTGSKGKKGRERRIQIAIGRASRTEPRVPVGVRPGSAQCQMPQPPPPLLIARGEEDEEEEEEIE